MFSTIKKNFVLFSLLGLAVVTLAHPHSIEESDTVDLHAREAHAHNHFEDIVLRSLDESDIEAATNEVLARSDGDLFKREIVKRDLGSDIRKCRSTRRKCLDKAASKKGRDKTDAQDDCDHEYSSCVNSALRYASKGISSKDAKGNDCAICKQSLHGGDRVATLPCGHYMFHTGCVGSWISGHNSCPLCRRSVY